MWGRDATRRLVAALVTTAALLAPASAFAASGDSVTVVSDPGDSIGAGGTALYMPPNGSITTTMFDSGVLSVGVDGAPGAYTMTFAPPPGEALTVGSYDRAQQVALSSVGFAGIGIQGNYHGCDATTGRFRVKDLAVVGNTVERVWIVYEQHCEGRNPALFGEIKIGETGPDGPAQVAPSAIRWPKGDLGMPGTPVPVTVRAAEAMQITSAEIEGADAGDLSILTDDCTGRSLSADSLCQVWVRPDRATVGASVGTLAIADSTGHSYSVSLESSTFGGRTRLVMVGGSSAYIPPSDANYGLSNAAFMVTGTRQHVHFVVDPFDKTASWADFTPASGDVLLAGSTYNATRYPWNGADPGIDVVATGGGCSGTTGRFTVRELTFDDAGNLETASISFIQQCAYGLSPICGLFEWRARSDDPGDAPLGDCNPPSQVADDGGTASLGGTTTSAVPQTTRTPMVPPPFPTPVTRTAANARHLPAGSPCAAAKFKGLRARLGTSRANRLVGTNGPDRLFGVGGDDVIRGRAGADCIDGGSGNDRISGGPGRDVIYCGPGKDTVYVTPGDVTRGCEKKIRER